MERGVLVGIDLGGTNVRAGVVTPEGALLNQQELPIEAKRGPEAGLQTITGLVQGVVAHVGRPVLAVGVGSTGPLDRERGFIQNPYTLPGWEDVDILSPLKERFGVPVALENDADAAALGEAWVGAGRGAGSMVMITIGTGVGFGLVLDGEIHRGIGGEHPEGGHILIDPQGPLCYCGAHGCLESLVSGPAIASKARVAALEEKNGYLGTLAERLPGGLEGLDARHVFEGARSDDDACLRLVDQTAGYIARGVITILMSILPDVVVFTGGVVRSFDLMEVRIRHDLAKMDVIIPAERVELQVSQTAQSGLLGAARAAQLLLREVL